jgi:hypothetical protein
VNRFRGKTAAYWYSGLGEYKKNAKYSADYSHGKVVSVAKAKVGRMPAHRHVETYTDPQAKQRIYYGELEIRPSKDAVLDVIVNVAAATPNARRTVEAMLDGVTAEGGVHGTSPPVARSAETGISIGSPFLVARCERAT